LLELKATDGQSLKIGEKEFTKDDLIKCFDFYEVDENWDLFFAIKEYPFVSQFEDFSTINTPLEFEDKLDNLHLKQFISNNYSFSLKSRIRFLLGKEDVKSLLVLTTYFQLFTDEFRYELCEFIKIQFSLKFKLIETKNYRFEGQARKCFLFKKDFTFLIDYIGNEDDDFLVECFNLIIELYNRNRISNYRYLYLMKLHLKISHSEHTKSIIKENFKKGIKYLLFRNIQIKIFLFFVVSGLIASLFKPSVKIDQKFEKEAIEIYEGRDFYTEISKGSVPYQYKEFYNNTIRKVSGYLSSFSPLIKDGNFNYFSPEGKLYLEGNFNQNKKVGEWKALSPQGNILEISNYQSDKLNGDRYVYFEDGAYSKEIFINDSSICIECITKSGLKVNCNNFNRDAVFSFNSKSLSEYIQEKIIYPNAAIENNIEGKVYVKFQISKYGVVEKPKIIQSIHPILDKSALLLICNLPNWMPAYKNGRLVKSNFLIPINFKLE
jgi:TonB family protein